MKIVLVCIGQFQSYITDCVNQLMLWGNLDITILTDTEVLQQELMNHLPKNVLIKIIYPNHCQELFNLFESSSRLSHEFRNGFFRHCFKRFIYLCEYMKEGGETDILHFENDIMVYRNTDDWKQLLFQSNLAIVMDSVNRCIPSVMYFKDHVLLEECLSRHIDPHENDMEFWAKCKLFYPEKILTLPIIYEYPEIPNNYYENYSSKIGIFDGAAIGQYFGGVNPENDDNDTRGFINETCMIKYNKHQFSWRQDPTNGLWKPMILRDSNWIPINNLHIHSKRLRNFNSIPICVSQLEHKLCSLFENNDLFSKESFQKFINHFFYFNEASSGRKLPIPLWNLPIICIEENEMDIFLKTHHVFIRRPFILICQNNSTFDIPEEILRNALDKPNCLSIFMQMPPSMAHDKIHILPIGLPIEHSHILREIIYDTPFKHVKEQWLYCPLHMIPKDYVYECKKMVDESDYKSYLLQLSRYKYCICDHSELNEFYKLFWDCIRMQVIPIVEKSANITFDIQPIVVVDRWKDISSATENYIFPNYPLFDSELYKDKFFKIINR